MNYLETEIIEIREILMLAGQALEQVMENAEDLKKRVQALEEKQRRDTTAAIDQQNLNNDRFRHQ